MLYIDGVWRHASSNDVFVSTNPADGTTIDAVADANVDDVREAIDAADAAFADWSATNVYERSAALRRAYDLMKSRQEELARLLTREQGKPLRMARTELNYASDFLLWYSEEAKRLYGRTVPTARSDQRLFTRHEAVGVVGAITPWNYPVSMITRKVAPALAAGCTVVLKPAEQTPLCAQAVFDVLHEAGLPPGAVNLVPTSDPESIGAELVRNPSVRKITFTGSTKVGRLLGRGAGEHLKRISLELGGHAPFVVLEDADPVHAAKGATALKFLNMGQACICPNRILVHRTIAQEFLATMVDRFAGLKVGNGFDDAVTVGPLVDEAALVKMEAQIADAQAKGARIAVGGERLSVNDHTDGHFFAPTLLTGISPSMVLWREETFGPIAAVRVFDHDDEALEMANDTDYGLASYVYTRDLKKAFFFMERLRFGIVGVNDINPTSAAAPFGGVKQSGFGREGGFEGIYEYLDTKLIGLSV